MGDYRTVATITVVLQNLLQQAVAPLAGAHVRTGRPERIGVEHPAGVVNLFLYQTAPNAAFRNSNTPTRRADGTLLQRPRVALDLYYLMSFYGEDREQIPQQLLGLTVSALAAWPLPLLGPEPPPAALAEFPDPALLTFSPVTLSLEELSKFWLMFQIPYALSIAYRGSVALIDADLTPAPAALPVRRPPLLAFVPTRRPRIDRIDPPQIAAAAGAAITVVGSGLAAPETAVRIGGALAAPLTASDGALTVPLPASLPAGPLPVQVVHQVALGEPPTLRPAAESNLAAFVLLPVVGQATFTPADPASPDASPAITVAVAPAVARGQTATLLLDPLQAAAGEAAAGYAIPAAAGASGESFTFNAAGVAPATYLVRIQVDATASVPTVDETPGSPTLGQYAAPTVVVP
jgi:hypothetical protein